MIYLEYDSLSYYIYLPYLKWWVWMSIIFAKGFGGYKSTGFLLSILGLVL
jgi:hypothetical protein